MAYAHLRASGDGSLVNRYVSLSSLTTLDGNPLNCAL